MTNALLGALVAIEAARLALSIPQFAVTRRVGNLVINVVAAARKQGKI